MTINTDSDTEKETLRALHHVTRRKLAPAERDAIAAAMDEAQLTANQRDLLGKLKTEFAAPIAEFQAKRRPIRPDLPDYQSPSL